MKKLILELSIIYLLVTALKRNPNNARTHSKKQIRQIADSIEIFGFNNPILIDKANVVIAGHGRLAAAKLLGMTRVPVIMLEDLTPEQIRAYVIADNRLAELAGWDKSILSIELQNLVTIEETANFEATITGFDIPEIDVILQDALHKPDKDDFFEVKNCLAVTQPGNIWVLGKHRILCGNATQLDAFMKLMVNKRAASVFTDPPYNVSIDGNVGNIGGKGPTSYREFQMAAGEMDEFQFTAFLISVLKLLARFSIAGSVHFVCMDWRHVGELTTAGKQIYESLLNVCVWVKNTGGMGSFYRSRHELVFVFKNGKGQNRNNIQLGRYGRNRTNVWEYPSAVTLSRTSEEGNLLALHPTVKPVSLIADALLDTSARGDIVLDPFLGSGSTLIAAERTGRICYGIELDPLYVDVAMRRWQRYTGDQAVDSVTGRSFDEIAVEKTKETQNV